MPSRPIGFFELGFIRLLATDDFLTARIGAAVLSDNEFANDGFIRNGRTIRARLTKRLVSFRFRKPALYGPFFSFNVRIQLHLKGALPHLFGLALVPHLVKQGLSGIIARPA